MSGLTDRVALITGSSRGIGAATALALAKCGADIAINYATNVEAAREVQAAVRALGRGAEIYQADVTSEVDCARLAEQAVDHFGRVDILVNNAASTPSGAAQPIADTDIGRIEMQFDQNVKGPFYLCKALIPQMRKLGRADIVMVSSTSAQNLSPRMGPYSIGKAGMEALAHTIAKEERAHGIRVNIVSPGLVETAMGTALIERTRGTANFRTLDSESPFGMVCQPDDVANAIVFLCSSEGRYITNQRLTVNGGGF